MKILIEGDVAMTKQILIFAILCSLFTVQASEAPICETSIDENLICELPVKKDGNKVKPAFARPWSTYITSLVLSGAIGATTGGLTRYFEKRFNIEASPIGLVLGIFGWLLESEIRNDSIAVLQNDLDIYHIGRKKSLMFKCAWIASWLAYLNV